VRILALTHTYPRSAEDTNGPFVRFLMDELARRGHAVHVLAAHDPDYDPAELGADTDASGRPRARVSTWRYAPVEGWHRLGYSRSIEADVRLRAGHLLLAPALILCGILRLLQETRRLRPDLLQAHWFLPGGFIAAVVSRICGVPLVITLHGSDVFVAEKGFPFSWMTWFTARTAARLTSCSPELRDRICRLGFPRERSHVVPYAADPAQLAARPAVEEVHALRRRLLADGGTELVLALGRLVHKKGFDDLLRALPAACAARPGLRLCLAGEGDLEPDLRALAAELGVAERVIFAGRLLRGEVALHMAACDLLAMPSVRDRAGNIDGLPNVILEAMAAGKPVLATRVAGIPLAVRPGRSGWLVPERDPAALSAALVAAFADPAERERLGAGARRLVEEELNWPAIAARYETIFALATSRAGAGKGR
jgi:glycosyltransferase involved in cell wall biosynthesis